MKKKKNGGFTLVELLAVLAVLSLISSMAVILMMDIIDKANKKSMDTTINNVLTMAESYVIENPENSIWKPTQCSDSNDNDCEYKCVTMANMIELRYFNNDILNSNKDDDIKFTKNDSVYVERDSVTKTIKNKSLDDPNCSANAIGNINFIVSPTGWSREKTITIEYELNADVNMNDAKYSYYYLSSAGNQNNSNLSFDSLIEKEKLTINSNGSLSATINTSSGSYTKSYYATKIDRTAPSGSMESLHKLAYNQTVQLTLSDSTSGIKSFYFGKSNPASTSVEFEKVANLKNMTLTKEVDSAGTWYLQVMDMAGNVSNPVTYMFFETKLNFQNINFVTNRILDVPGSKHDLSKLKMEVHKYYTLNGWYNDEGYNNAVSTPEEYQLSILPLYGKVTENVFEGEVTINGIAQYGKEIKTVIKKMEPNNGGPGAISYSYQWYYNDTRKNSGGVLIEGATKSTYTIGANEIGKYIYVEVTVKKDNYRDCKFVSPPSTIVEKVPGYINLNKISDSIVFNSTTSKTINVSSHHGGELSVSDNSNFVLSYINGTVVTLDKLDRALCGEIEVTVTSGETAFYSSASVKYTLSVIKANNPIIVTGKSLTYTGKDQTLVTVSNAQGKVYYSTSTSLTSNNYYSKGLTTIPSARNVGTYTIYYYVEGNTNYNSKSSSVTTTIKSPTCSSGYTMISGKCCPNGYDSLYGNYCVRSSYTYDGNTCSVTYASIHESNSYSLSADDLSKYAVDYCSELSGSFSFDKIDDKNINKWPCEDYSSSHFASGPMCYEFEYTCKSKVASDCTVAAKNPS